MHSLATSPGNLQVASGPRRARARGEGGWGPFVFVVPQHII
jgi:hypothetical protein